MTWLLVGRYIIRGANDSTEEGLTRRGVGDGHLDEGGKMVGKML